MNQIEHTIMNNYKIHDVIYHVSEITYSTSKQQNYTALKCSGIDCEIDTFYSCYPNTRRV